MPRPRRRAHRSSPVAVLLALSLLGPTAGLIASPAARPGAVRQTLSLDEVLTRHRDARGGDALRAVRTLRSTGTIASRADDVPDPPDARALSAPFVQEIQVPARLRLEIRTADGKRHIQASDGGRFWALWGIDDGTLTELPPAQAARQMRLAAIEGPLLRALDAGHPLEWLGTVQLRPDAATNVRSVYRVRVRYPNGDLTDIDIDPTSFQIVATHDTWHIEGSIVRVVGLYDDHRAIDGGITLPHQIEQVTSQGVRHIRIDHIAVDVPIDPARFQAP
ncbi:MAG: hypothetical protein AAF772_01615 [Acidobacteriota bacterium]